MIVLVDLDGVVADFEGAFWPRFLAKHPDAPYIAPESRKTFYVEDQIGREWRQDAEAIIHSEGFFLELPPLERAVEGVLRLSEDFRVILCTSPISTPWCASEKHQWVQEHLGKPWTKQLVVTKDKTLIRGEYLIDDRPEVTGDLLPQWEHIHYEHAYNLGYPNRRLTWEKVLDGRFKF